MQVREQWLTSDAPTVLTADLLWADRLAQNLKSSLIMIEKSIFFFLGHGWKNLSNVIFFFFFLCPGWKKMSQMWHYFSSTSFIVKLMYVWYTCNRCVKQHERICDGSGLRYACLYSYSPFLLVLGEVSKLWHSFNVIKVWIKNHIGSQHWGFSSCPFNGNK